MHVEQQFYLNDRNQSFEVDQTHNKLFDIKLQT